MKIDYLQCATESASRVSVRSTLLPGFVRACVAHACLALVCLALVCLVLGGQVFAASEQRQFDSAEQRALYLKLINEFRCLKCQNQNLAGSSAALAGDLKNEIHSMVLDNKSSAEISDFLVTRYGDFVRYKPPFKMTTALLWFSPFLLMLIGIWLLTRFAGQKATTNSDQNEEELSRARSLLED